MLKRYMAAREIGISPLATTHLAVQHGDGGLRRLVVAKALHSVVGIEFLFRRCRTLATLEHHNLARVLDQGIDEGRPLVVYDYVIGENLLSVLGRCVRIRRPVPTPLAVRIVADACGALHAGHTASSPDGAATGVIHGAVRPSNLMVSYAGCTKVVDFGIDNIDKLAREEDLSPAQAHSTAPEVLDGGPVDGRADVYSAAVVLYALLTLRYPYDAPPSVAGVKQARSQRRPVPPSARSAAVPVELERVLLRALSLDPQRRQGSAEELQHELERFLSGETMPTTPLDLAAYLASLFGKRIAAKLAALRALLSMPPGSMLPGETTVEVVAPEIDERAFSHMFATDGDPTTEVESMLFDGDEPVPFDGPPTTPEVGPHRKPRADISNISDFTDATDPDADDTTEDEEDTAVRRSR